MQEYAAIVITPVCRDSPVNPLEQNVVNVGFLNLQDILIITKPYLGMFVASFWKKHAGCHSGFSDSQV